MEGNDRPTTKYYKGENKVIAKLENTRTIGDEMRKYSNNTIDYSDYVINVCLEELLNNFVPSFHKKEILPQYRSRIFTGTARCDERDEFDPEKGKKIASLKADLKYHNRMYKDYKNIISALMEFEKMLMSEGLKHSRCSDQIYNKLVKEYGWEDKRGEL